MKPLTLSVLYPGLLVALACAPLAAWSMTKDGYPAIEFRKLPNAVQRSYVNEKPNLGENGRCSTAFDSTSDQEKMIFTCSIYIKIGSEGARRSMNRCEDQRKQLHVKAPCAVIVE
ncbi:MAG: hypothetical protein EBV20_11720 [Betaproteobacteria bacterium]|jgi:hypothetical protein|nr:hypothetical protein [Betaproteobacteria bacterium]NBP45729.1 hypothetical protein [Betaproteobacteria bacterium]